MKVLLSVFFCWSLFSLSGCEKLFKDTEKLAYDIEEIDDDINRIKEDF